MSQSRADILRAHFSSCNGAPRPLLTSLNGDSSWLTSFPRPAAERARPGGKAYFHIVSDHLDEATLRTFHPEIPVFATAESAAIVYRWGHFFHVIETRDLDPAAAPGNGWRSLHPQGSLPDRLTVFRLRGHHELNFATAIIYSSSPEGSGGEDHETKHEALLYSPHGIKTDQPSLKAFAGYLDSAGDGNGNDGGGERVSVLAILHALKDSFSFGMAMTLGVAGGLALERLARPRYWVKSHDAPLQYAGVVAWLAWINDVARTLGSGLNEEQKEVNGGEDRGKRKQPNMVEVENGGCFALE